MVTRRTMVLGAGAAALAGVGVYASMSRPSYDDAVKALWEPATPVGSSDLDYLVHYATLAANSHNTQPWLFSGSQDQVTIRPDFTRATPAADTDNHHLFASLGCASENLALAAGATGKGAAIDFADEGDGAVKVDMAGAATGRDPLFDAILGRQCTRSDYDGRAVSSDDMKALEAAAAVEGCTVVLIPEKPRIEEALELVVAGNTEQMSNPAFVSELKHWLRFNAATAIETKDGLYAGCSGNPTLPTWLGNIMFDFAFKPKAENDKYARQIRSSSGLAVFVSDKDDKAHWVQAGRSYQRFALQATALGIRHAFINQPVEVASVRPEFTKWLGIGDRRPDLVVRYGYAPLMPRSLRRPVADVIV